MRVTSLAGVVALSAVLCVMGCSDGASDDGSDEQVNGQAGAGASAGGTSGNGTAGMSGQGDAGAAEDVGSEPLALVDCEAGSEEPCGTFVTIKGTEIPLGPYGAIMEPNVGQGFETVVNAGDMSPANCQLFAAVFGEDPDETAQLLDTMDLDFALYTIYRPANWVEGEKYPIITWGNGTCAQPEGYGALLRYVASHGYVVVAANSRFVGSNSAMTKALDFVFAANEDPDSPYYQRLDTERVGAMGHSQGSGATVTAARDERIDAVILWNGGTSAVKTFLAVSGDYDIGNPTATTYSSGLSSASGAGAYLFFHMVPMTGSMSGHLTLMTQPERVVDFTVSWWDMQLRDDTAARDVFVGDSCGLCGHDDEYEYGQQGL